jgi:hypothetical protein
MTQNPEENPRILVDSDWKAQVEAEKEALRQKEHRAEAAPGEKPTAAAEPSPDQEALPPPSFAFLITSLATQAMVALGQIPDPFENKPVVRLPLARHHIDLLGMLEEKTQGNLAADEKSLLTHVLTDLRMAFVAVERRQHR